MFGKKKKRLLDDDEKRNGENHGRKVVFDKLFREKPLLSGSACSVEKKKLGQGPEGKTPRSRAGKGEKEDIPSPPKNKKKKNPEK